MSMRQFIRENREMIDLFIRKRIGARSVNDEDRRQYILARSEGVRI